MKRYLIPFLYLILLLSFAQCTDSKINTLDENTFESEEKRDSTDTEENNKYVPTNFSASSYWGDTTGEFDVIRFLVLLEEDSLKKAALYLKQFKISETDSTNINIYKSNLANILIRQGKFEEVVRLLSDVIRTEKNTIPERLLRSEAYIQIDSIQKAMSDLNHVIDNGGRYRWRAYRQRGIIKYEMQKDSVGGCEDLKKSVVNDYSKKIYGKYCN